eukprot:TRINITY_DN1173_c0_g1_i1.p1 TRINITY_DN1173_c0_g1~~TRINITY_DN1173_c0_g1_i1.p1  ORF type:complete len:389 (+),score=105.34 TRINITY_DN1173_c0_g1_i1:62-1168(+)
MALPAARDYNTIVQAFESKIPTVMAQVGDTDYPSATAPDSKGLYKWDTSSGWTSGFFPGTLWQMANMTGNASYAAKAAAMAAGRAKEANDTSTHDIGFMTFGSFGNGIKLWEQSNKAEYEAILTRAAHSLAQRYNPTVGMTRSWGSIDDDSKFEVIIDNLLNLELLFWVAAQTSNQTLYDMAVSHVDRTAQFWIRPDGSTFHLVVFDPKTGAVISRSGTPQGLAVNSTWARGQAWGIYGFTMAYRYTQQARFLDYALNVTEYWLANTNADFVPLWDFDCKPDDFRDTSSAAITASAFVELAGYVNNATYVDLAKQIVASLTKEPYFAGSASQAILQANGHDCKAAGCTVVESDYYLLEAVRRLQGAPF